nr:MAG TPA: nucleoid-associated protein [Caudoviricetes sp.]
MADKTIVDKAISDLTQALQITGEDLFVLEQSGEAKKLKGATLLDFVTLNVVSVTVTTLPAGSSATAIYDKSTGTLALGIPQGSKGDTGATGATGPANVLTIGSVTSGKVANATITGEAPNQVLNLVLEKGEQGEQGKQGIQGEIGPQGNPGADAPTITGITIRQSDYHLIVTLSDGTSYDAGYCRGQAGAGTGDMLAAVYDPNNKHTDIFEYVDNAIKDVKVTTDATPTQGSTNPVQSGGVYSALANKLNKTGDGSNVTAAFTAATTRANIATGEKFSVLFGKIAKWLSDLGSLAFKSTVAKSDLASDVQASLGKADSALQSAPVTSVNSKTGAVNLAKGDVGLGNVDNVKQYSASNPPPYPVTSVNGKTGAVTIASAPSTSAMLKGNGSGGIVAATRGSDYIASGNIVKQTLVASETTPTENYAINWLFG